MISSFSIIIIAYNSEDFLPSCLQSIQQSKIDLPYEVIVWDNASPQPLSDDFKNHYPNVRWLSSDKNLGFGKACNRAAQEAKYEHFFFVNPDTMVGRETFQKLIAYVETQEQVGSAGCKILSGDGSLQWACRRSFPSPMSAIFKTLGLGKLFPKNKTFNEYNLSYLSEEQSAPVDALSGSFFLVSKKVFDEIGGFDEDYFLYGEDLDLFYRIQQKGYHNYYYAETSVVHFKGQSFATRRVRSYIDFYQAMMIFVKKHKQHFKPFPVSLLRIGIFFAALQGVFSRLLPQWWKVMVDTLLGGILAWSSVHLGWAKMTDVLLALAPFIFLILLQGDYAKHGLRQAIPRRSFILGSGIISSLAALISGNALLLPICLVFAFLIPFWRKTVYWSGFFQNIFQGNFMRTLAMGRGDRLHKLFLEENVLPGREVLGVLTQNNILSEVPEEVRPFWMGGLERVQNIHRRTGFGEILLVADRFGYYGGLPEREELEKLGLDVRLLVGDPEKHPYAIVDLKWLS
jgi:GT2 family glycosyltransferase